MSRFFYGCGDHRDLPSFPTRRSSDLDRIGHLVARGGPGGSRTRFTPADRARGLRRGPLPRARGDRKSTRLNSSHGYISYAVFCLKKKTKLPHNISRNSRGGGKYSSSK